MGIHNSSNLSTERRVVNHHTFKLIMKAFMTVCALLAASAHADSQVFMGRPQFYHQYLQPQVGFSTYGYGMPSYGMVMPNYYHPRTFIKREADADMPYEVRSKMTTSPLSRQEYKVQVDQMGNGQSYQHVERQQDMYSDLMMRDRQMMDRQRMMDRNQQRMDMDRERMMEREQQRMDMDRQRMMYDMDRQRKMDRDQYMMDKERQRMDMDRQMMDLNRERMMDMRNMDEDRMDRYMDQQMDQGNNNQMIQTHRMMIKREALSDPAFTYTVMAEHPSTSNQMMSSSVYQLPLVRQNMNLRQMTMKQIHPDGAFSFVRQPVNFPSTTSLYNMLNRIRPAVAMF